MADYATAPDPFGVGYLHATTTPEVFGVRYVRSVCPCCGQTGYEPINPPHPKVPS